MKIRKRESFPILVKEKIAIVTIFGLEEEASNSITGTADDEHFTGYFKAGRAHRPKILLEDLVQATISELTHLISAPSVGDHLLESVGSIKAIEFVT